LKPDSERWQQIVEIFHAARERNLASQRAFLDIVCAGDESLRREVESLLQPGEVERLMASPAAVEMIEKILDERPTADTVSLAPGTSLGPYVIVSYLGHGGMGEVYRARDPRLGRDLAIKILSPHPASVGSRHRFEQEARAAAALNHPNIVTIYDVGEAEGFLYIAMEFLEGRTLREVAVSAITVDRLLKIAVQLADGLVAAHERRIVHRDLKPENIILSPDDTVKILDFGIAKTELPGQRPSAVTTSTFLRTRTGVILGTAGYMSPEQARGLVVDYRSDQFSLGAILYELASGLRAFERPSPIEALVAVIVDEPQPLDRLVVNLPPPLQWTIERCLSKSPDDRYLSTRDLHSELRAVHDRLHLPPGSHQNVHRVPAQFPHLALTRWPFPVVPDREYCKFMADRQELQAELKDLLRALSRRDTSSIHLFWAWFGAGKTHTLLYLAHLAEIANQREVGTALLTVYSEFPKSVRGFLDVFRTFTMGSDPDRFVEAYLEIRTCPSAEMLQRRLVLASPDLASALHVMATGDAQQHLIAVRWLRGEAVPTAQLRSIGVTKKIDSAEESVRILAALADLLNEAARSLGRTGARLIWILDEFQRIEQCSAKLKEEINTGLRATFNACPNGLSLFLSFSGNPQKGLPSWLSRELRDRIGRTKIFVLPPMRSDEALTFVKDVLHHFRPTSFNGDAHYFPFTLEAVQTILTEIAKTSELRPRAIMHAMSAVLEEADDLIERGQLSRIDRDFALRALSQRVPLPQEASGGSL
jgi:serine/threonine protein kinase